MDVALYISRRLSFGVDGRRRSPSVGIAVAGIAIAMVVMMLTMAIVSGFKSQIGEKLSGFDAQITLTPLPTAEERGDVYAQMTPGLDGVLDAALPGEANVSLMLRQSAVIKTADDFEAIALEGVAADRDVSFIKDNIIEGDMPDYSQSGAENDIVISLPVASRLGLAVGDKADVFFFDGDRLKLRKLRISAIYESHFGEFDRVIGFASLPMLQRVAGLDSLQAATIRVTGLPDDMVEPLTEALNESLAASYYDGRVGQYYVAQSVYKMQPTYYGWLELLDTNVLVILILMGCVSGFTLISCLFILILERVRMIGLLKALGAGSALVRRVFIYMACRVILLGVIIGDVVAALLLWIQGTFHVMKLDADAYCLNYVPVELSIGEAALLNVAVVLISVLLLIVPSHIVAGISPARTMRYE